MSDLSTKTTRELLISRYDEKPSEYAARINAAIARDERQTAEIKSLQDKIIECATVYAKHRTDDANVIAAAELAGDALESINREKTTEIERLTKIIAAVRELCRACLPSHPEGPDNAEQQGAIDMAVDVLEILNQEPTR